MVRRPRLVHLHNPLERYSKANVGLSLSFSDIYFEITNRVIQTLMFAQEKLFRVYLNSSADESTNRLKDSR